MRRSSSGCGKAPTVRLVGWDLWARSPPLGTTLHSPRALPGDAIHWPPRSCSAGLFPLRAGAVSENRALLLQHEVVTSPCTCLCLTVICATGFLKAGFAIFTCSPPQSLTHRCLISKSGPRRGPATAPPGWRGGCEEVSRRFWSWIWKSE